MYGFSYVGATQLQAAIQRPPSLRAICPALTGSQFYDGWAYNGGAFSLAFNASWATQLAAQGARRAGDDEMIRELETAFVGAPNWYGYLPLNEYPPLSSNDHGRFFFDWLSHPTDDEYWRRWSIDEDYSRIDVPALHIGGWYDIFVQGTVKNFGALRQSVGSEQARLAQKLLVGPWYHIPWSRVTGAVDFGREGRNVVDQWQLRWFDHFLKGEDSGVLDSPVTVFLTGRNYWQDETSWPPEGAVLRPYYLHSNGVANSINGDGSLNSERPASEPPDVFTYDPLPPTPSAGGRSCCFPFVAPMGPADQIGVEVSNGVLVYTSEVLERDLTVIGPVHATLYAISSAVDTDFTVKLCDVSSEGQSINIVGGIIRARYRESLIEPKRIVSGEVYEYMIDLGPTAHVFLAGHRIRIQVSSSDFPQWDRNMNTGGTLGFEGPAQRQVATQLVLHDAGHASHVTLPVLER